MQRRVSKKSRGANAAEKRFMAWVKEQPCCICGSYPCNVDHVMGSTYRHNRVLIGMWFLLPLCLEHDQEKTQGSRKAFREAHGLMADKWVELVNRYPHKNEIPVEVIEAIRSCGQ